MKSKVIPHVSSPLSDWLTYIKNLHDTSIDMNLFRVSKVAEYLDILQPAPFVFTVTGTNGKGTTCCMLESILIASGYKVGVYSSPHLVRHTERVRIQNTELPDSAHIAAFSAIEGARRNISLTYFEYSTLSALWLFKHANLDIVILEVGMGGRLDATNIVDGDIAIVTNIALDHTDWLGYTRESIGREKAGIFRSAKPAIIGDLDIPKTIIQSAKEKKTTLLCRDIHWRFSVFPSETWSFSDKQGKLINLPPPRIPNSNAAIALAALRASDLKIEEYAIREGIKHANLPGRFQIISKSPLLILDVAHNPHAAIYLAERIKLISNKNRVLAVIGMLHNKDIAATVFHLENIVYKWYCAPLQNSRGASVEMLTKYLGKGKIYENIVQAWYAAMNDAVPKDIVIVCGSFHTVSDVMKEISMKRNNNSE